MAINKRVSLFSVVVFSGLLFFPQFLYARQTDEGIRVEVPTDVVVKVENRFGSVDVEVWTNPYVSVSISGSARPKRSPLVINNQRAILSLSTVKYPNESASIDLLVRIPQTAKLEIKTESGRIDLHGLSNNAVVRSVTGDITSSLSATANLAITARTARGLVTSMFDSAQASGVHEFQTRLGSASSPASFQSDSGNILLTGASEKTQAEQIERKQPTLIAPNSSATGAGTPDTKSDSDEISEGDVIRVDSQLVTVNVSAIDRGTNRGLVGLQQFDFKLFEDGQQQVISRFESASAPFDLVLLIDLSGSTKEKVKLIRDAALHFVNAARTADRIAVVTFAGQPTLVSEFTLDRELLRQRISAIDTSHGDTKLYDATEFVINDVVKKPNLSRRTAVVLMSDGLDGTIPGVSGQIGSKTPYAGVLRDIQEFDGVLYTLWLDTTYVAMSPQDTQPEAFDAGYDRMKEMADVGGGLFYEVKRLEDLAGAYEKVVDDLGTVYSLTYRPANKTRDHKWRSIRIDIARSNAVARGKRGYYAN